MKFTLALLAALLASSAQAAITLSMDPYPAGPNQPTACSWDASGQPIVCIFRRLPDGSVVGVGDATRLAPGSYVITASVTNAASGVCTGGPAAFTCDNGLGPSLRSAPINLVITSTGSPPAMPIVHITAP